MARSPLFSRKQPGGVYHIDNTALTVGNIWYVDTGSSGKGTTAAYGYNPDAPFSTVAACLDSGNLASGDIAFVAAGHTETISAAAGWDIDTAGIQIRGLGWGNVRPKLTMDTATTTDIDIDAASVLLENLILIAGYADIAAAIDVNSDDFTIRNCVMKGDNAGLNAKIWIQDAAATASDRITVEDCYCMDKDAANTHFINFAGTGDGHIVRRNVLIGDWGTMCIGGAGVVTNATITDNVISNDATDNDSCINFAATATGICMRNLACGGAAQANGITATAMAIAQNYYGVVTEDLSAILEPIAT